MQRSHFGARYDQRLAANAHVVVAVSATSHRYDELVLTQPMSLAGVFIWACDALAAAHSTIIPARGFPTLLITGLALTTSSRCATAAPPISSRFL